MTTINIHNFNGQQLRHVILDGEPWFHATDVCHCLGLRVAHGVHRHLVKLSDDEKGRNNFATPGGTQKMSIVSESGLYKLILRANPSRPEVAKFQNWVTREVLPSIRKTGGYLLNENARETAHADTKDAMPMPAEFLQVFKQMFENARNAEPRRYGRKLLFRSNDPAPGRLPGAPWVPSR